MFYSRVLSKTLKVSEPATLTFYCRGVILLDECLLYIEESLAHVSLARAGDDPSLQRLSKILNTGVLFESLKRRAADMRKNVKGTAVELVSIQKMAAVISETQQANHHDIADLTCRRLADVHQNMERSMAHLDVMKSLLGGIFSMELFDRILGFHYGMASNTINSSPSFMEPIRSAVVIPGVLLLLILIFWYLLKKLWYERRYKTITAHTTIDLDMSIKYVLNIAIDVTRLHEMLKFKFIMQEEIVNDDLNSLRKTIYVEMDALKWRGFPPKIALQYDEETAFLLQATFYLNRSKTRLSSQEVFKMFIEDLALAKVVTADQSKEIVLKNSSALQEAAQAVAQK